MVLINPLMEETVTFDDHIYPLAADFRAPLALSLAELNLRKREIDKMFKAKNYKGKSRLARLQIYDPRKIPVLFIHGLGNSPATWMPMIEFLRNDETIRHHYQFWAFSYPSGQPFPIPAATLRRLLDQIDKRYPEHKDIVVIGHSMGGQIASLLATDSGMVLWDQLFDKPPGEMGFSEPTRLALAETLVFKARPNVSRVVYASASHRGSKKATNRLSRLGSKLIGSALEETTVTKEALAAVRPGSGGRKGTHLPNSIDILDPGNPFLEAVNTLTPKPGIPFHSIIGDRGKGGNLDRSKPVSSDGIVPYWSSHLHGAESELVIPSGHWTILHHQCMAEVKRILLRHLEED
jgi:pimeloyl-ACP methyl ester carboxylesterase